MFADKCHHGKEEDVLFPELEKAGIARQGGPIGVMLHEHVSGREFIRRMSEALPARNDKEFAEAACSSKVFPLVRRLHLTHLSEFWGPPLSARLQFHLPCSTPSLRAEYGRFLGISTLAAGCATAAASAAKLQLGLNHKTHG